jgi:hypothetical protein
VKQIRGEKYILAPAQFIYVKEEDLDWLVYHLITGCNGETCAGLVRATGCPEPVIEASLNRLENYMLVEREGSWFQPLSPIEMMVKCQSRYDKNSPIVIEHGVIRARDDRET